MLEVIYKNIDDLIPYVNNTRTHSKEQVNQIASSIKEFGFTNPVLIDEQGGLIAGHGRVMGAKKLGLKEVPTITLNNLTEAQKKAYIIADNKIGDNSTFDEELLKIEIEALQDMDFNIDLLGFSDEELLELDINFDFEDSKNNEEDENPYSQKVEAPTYEPTGEKPSFEDMYNAEKALSLIEEIESSSADKEIKEFLKLASYRHIQFNYEQIAEFYTHQDKEVQELMENSALVIIDFNKAIENGFVSLSKKIEEIRQNSDEDE